MKFISILTIVLVIFSCTTNNKNINQYHKIEPVGKLVHKKKISFPLDSTTTFLFHASEYNPASKIYSFLFNKKLLLYSYDKQQLLKKIDVDLVNPTSYTVINQDSIIVLDYSENIVAFLNSNGDIYKKIKVVPNIPYYPFPVNKTAPIRINKNELIFWGNMGGEYVNENKNNRKIMGILNLMNYNTSYKVPYTSIYGKYNWGGGLFRWVYADYNSKIDSYIISLPAEHYLLVISENGDIQEKVYAGSNYIDFIQSLSKPKTAPIDADMRTKYFVESNSYANIIYDSYKDLYYRIAEQKCTYHNAIGWKKRISIIILNSKFEKIGETPIDDYDLNCRYAMFVNEQGLHIPQESSDNTLCFNIYEYENFTH